MSSKCFLPEFAFICDPDIHLLQMTVNFFIYFLLLILCWTQEWMLKLSNTRKDQDSTLHSINYRHRMLLCYISLNICHIEKCFKKLKTKWYLHFIFIELFTFWKMHKVWFQFHIKYRVFWVHMEQTYIFLGTSSVDTVYDWNIFSSFGDER
jgi:hypothetical protein